MKKLIRHWPLTTLYLSSTLGGGLLWQLGLFHL